MVVICDKIYENNELVEHFSKFSFELSDFQKYAIEGLVKSQHVLITAHTGSGKTLPAEFAIEYFHNLKKKVIYTSPIKALSNQKFYEFTKKFPHISFGILTGDIKFNPEADVLIMTTEILQNTLFIKNNKSFKNVLHFDIDIENDLGCVIFDEIHYINDADRGKVWEQTIMMLPSNVQMLMLSATIDRPNKFASWIENLNMDENNNPIKQVYLAGTDKRVVPLKHYLYIDSNQTIFKLISDKEKQDEIKSIIKKLHILKDTTFHEKNLQKIRSLETLLNNKYCVIRPDLILNNLLNHLKTNNMLPAICFVFSRKNVEKYANQITCNLFDEDNDTVPEIICKECHNILRKLPNYKEIISLPEFHSIIKLLEKGIAIHHSGVIPVLREMTELLFAKGYIKILFATESFAVGINMPTKTVIFTSLYKYTKEGMRILHSHEYTQMAGRAGRRGLDTIGHVIHCYNLFQNNVPSTSEYRIMMNGVPQTLKSKFSIEYSLILNLLKNNTQQIEEYSKTSMLSVEIENRMREQYEYYMMLKKEFELTRNFNNIDEFIEEKLNNYINLEKECEMVNGNKKKKIRKKLMEIENSVNNFQDVINNFNKYYEKKNDYLHEEKMYYDGVNFISNNSKLIIKLLEKQEFITEEIIDNCLMYKLTQKGIIASNIREIPGILIAPLIENKTLEMLEIDEFIAFLSCFNDTKVSDDYKIFNIDNMTITNKLKNVINSLKTNIDNITGIECLYNINTNTANLELSYDLIPYILKWINAENEESCRLILEELNKLGIFVGDFSKALLKINNICNELNETFELINNVNMAYITSLVSDKILKFVVTNQSLYI